MEDFKITDKNALQGIADLNQKVLQNDSNYDLILIQLNTALLGLTIAFFDQIVDIKSATSLWMIYWAWGLWAISVCLVVISYPLATISFGEQYKKIVISNVPKSDESLIPHIERRVEFINGASVYMMRFAGGFFVVGILFFVIFSITNFMGKADALKNLQGNTRTTPTVYPSTVKPVEPKNPETSKKND